MGCCALVKPDVESSLRNFRCSMWNYSRKFYVQGTVFDVMRLWL
jgi:hypothetical protein